MPMEINLLRAVMEERAEKAVKRQKNAWFVFLAVLIFVALNGLIFGASFYLNGKNNMLLDEISAQKEKFKEVEPIEDKLKSLNSDLNQIYSTGKSALSWSKIMEKIASLTPADIQLKKIDVISSKAAAASPGQGQTASAAVQKIQLKITGETKSRRAVGLFQEKLLKETSFFSSADIISSEKIETGASEENQTTAEVINFEIDLTLKT